jgi:uncharacterized membrane protein
VGEKHILPALLAAAMLLTAVAWLRGAEYDEQYTLFLTGHVARPIWPAQPITAGVVQELQAADAGFVAIAHDLRATDVHPPLYFWTVAAWRRLAGNSLFAARLASVLFSVVTLGLVAAIARSTVIPAAPAILLTLGCYAFAYTGAIARGFALAQMLSVAGVALLLGVRRSPFRMSAASTVLGAATFANYLAAFVACAALLGVLAFAATDGRDNPRLRGGGHDGKKRHGALEPASMVFLGFAPWLPADAWFFIAQRQARVGQFEPFQPVAAATRLARYGAAAVFGGLPLYVDGVVRTLVATALALLLFVLLVLIVRRWRYIGTPAARRLLVMTAAAPAVGLLLLGFAFDNTPIELRYLAFATPFIGLLLAAALPPWLRAIVLAVQAIGLLGLITRPETMQPARATAAAAASLARDGVVLLPQGNDGVGIVGAFAAQSPPSLPLLVIGRDATPAEIRTRAAAYRRVVLVLLDQDAASRATLPTMRHAFADPCWREVAEPFKVIAFDRACQDQ